MKAIAQSKTVKISDAGFGIQGVIMSRVGITNTDTAPLLAKCLLQFGDIYVSKQFRGEQVAIRNEGNFFLWIKNAFLRNFKDALLRSMLNDPAQSST